MQGMCDPEYVSDFCDRMRAAQDCHYASARLFLGADGAMGWSSLALAALASTSLMTSVAETSDSMKWATAAVSATAAVILALRQGLKYSDRAENHRRAGSGYGALFEDLAQKPNGMTEAEIDAIQKRKADLGANAPLIPGFIRRRVLQSAATRP